VNRAIGRKADLARIDTFLTHVPGGARVLVIVGEPGMGKTTLWLAGVEAAVERGWQVLSARPSAAEATFAYAGIGDLLAGIDDASLSILPGPQRRVLRVALLREEPEGSAAEPGAVAVALLNTLRGLAESGPILVAVDDVQWLDTPSRLALGYAIRRLDKESIGVLLARRAEASADSALGLDGPRGRHALELLIAAPLPLAALREVLRRDLSVTFPRATLERIHAASGGNPLFALELARSLGSRPPMLGNGVDLPVPEELMSLIGDRLEDLPAATQDVLAIAASVAHPTVEVLARMIEHPVDDVLQPAIESGVVTVTDEEIRFTHPLRAIAARAGTSSARRREIHSKAATAMADPEERARHLALAAEGPSDDTAAVLEEAARRARARGAPGAASELLALAGRLTPPDRVDDLHRRGLAEAEYLLVSGDPLRSQHVVQSLLAGWPSDQSRGSALALLGNVSMAFDVRAARHVIDEALAEAGKDDRLRMRCEGLLTGNLDMLGENVNEALGHGRAELEIAERLGDDVHISTALRGIARNEQRLTGQMPVAIIERSLALEPRVQRERAITEWPSLCYAEMLSWTDDIGAGLALWEWLRTQAEERGDENSLGWVLAEMIPYECLAGAWEQALVHSETCIELAAGLGSLHAARAFAGRALVEAHLGDEVRTRDDAEEAHRLGGPSGALMAERTAEWALGILELSLGHPARAHDHLGPLVEGRRAAGVREPGDIRFVTDEVEALIGMERLEEAEELLGWFESLVEASGRVLALAACERSQGLLFGARDKLDEALAALERSKERYETVADPFGVARTLLALGTLQLRARHRRDARETLEAAGAVFDGLGAALWSHRVSDELGRIGGRTPSRDALTASERRVAVLAAEGQTNREVAARLYLAERTVEGHLSSVYAKLGIRSRTELVRRLAEEAEPEA
jgi:DNA-binding CsgD family transcriptional regulator